MLKKFFHENLIYITAMMVMMWTLFARYIRRRSDDEMMIMMGGSRRSRLLRTNEGDAEEEDEEDKVNDGSLSPSWAVKAINSDDEDRSPRNLKSKNLSDDDSENHSDYTDDDDENK
jgi:hypothetical protein